MKRSRTLVSRWRERAMGEEREGSRGDMEDVGEVRGKGSEV